MGEGRPRGEDRQSYSVPMLAKIMTDAMEPGYADRAARRGAEEAAGAQGGGGGHERPGGRRRRTLHITLALALLAAGFLITLTVTDVRRAAPDAAAARSELANRVQQRTILTDNLADEVVALRGAVASARDSELAMTRSGRARAKALAQLELETGAVAVTGPGIRVTVDDAPPRVPDGDTEADLGKVQDRDLQLVVNGLWDAGAEAVSVGGYRLTAKTAIRSAGEAILVDFRPISAPYVIEAVGDPARLRAQFLDGPGGRALTTLSSTYGIRFTSETVDSLTLPAAASLGDSAGPRGGPQ